MVIFRQAYSVKILVFELSDRLGISFVLKSSHLPETDNMFLFFMSINIQVYIVK